MKDLGRVHVESFLEMMSAERGAAVNTLQSYERDLDDLRSFLHGRSIRLTEAGSGDLGAYLASLSAQGFKPSSQARRLAAMRQFYKFLYAEGLRTDDPTGILDAPKKGRALPKTMGVGEVTKLLTQAEAEAADPAPGQLHRLRMRKSFSPCAERRRSMNISSAIGSIAFSSMIEKERIDAS